MKKQPRRTALKNACLNLGVLICAGVMVSCSNNELIEMDNRKIQIEEHTYTVEQVRRHLLEMFSMNRPVEEEIFAIWGSEDNRIAYSTAVTTDLDAEFFLNKIRKTMVMISELTGIDFYESSDLNEVRIVFGVTSRFEHLKDLTFIQHMDRKARKDKKKYDEEWQRLDLSSHTANRRFQVVIRDITLPSGEKMKSLWKGYLLMKVTPDRIKDRVWVESVTSGELLSNLFLGKILSKHISTSMGTITYKQAPYIWPFDKALIELAYANPGWSGQPLEAVVDQIIEGLLDQYGVDS